PLLNSPDSLIDPVQGAVMITTGTSRGPSRPSDAPTRPIAREEGAAPTATAGAATRERPRLDVEVEGVLPRMRREQNRVHIVLPLVVDPRLDDVGREDVPLEQPVIRLLEIVDPAVERPT